jgi:transposase
MARLEEVSADELRGHVDEVTEKRPTLRLVVGINYKEGVSQSALADWYAISRTTVHNWLSRLERLADEPFEDVIFDAERPGRPAKISPEQWDELVSILEESPDEVGIDAPHWSPKLVQILIHEKFDVGYSRRHVRELLNRAGFTWKTARLQFAKGDESARGAFREEFKKTDSSE